MQILPSVSTKRCMSCSAAKDWPWRWEERALTLKKASNAKAVDLLDGSAFKNIASHAHPWSRPWGFLIPWISVCQQNNHITVSSKTSKENGSKHPIQVQVIWNFLFAKLALMKNLKKQEEEKKKKFGRKQNSLHYQLANYSFHVIWI